MVQLRLLRVSVDASDLEYSGGDLCLTLGEDEAGSCPPEAESFSVYAKPKILFSNTVCSRDLLVCNRIL